MHEHAHQVGPAVPVDILHLDRPGQPLGFRGFPDDDPLPGNRSYARLPE